MAGVTRRHRRGHRRLARRDWPRSRSRVDDDYAPLRQRHAGDDQADLAVGDRQPLHRPPARARQTASDIDDGGRIGPDHTRTAVELDQVFDLFDQRHARVAAGRHQGPGGHVPRPRAPSCGAASTTSTRRCRPAARLFERADARQPAARSASWSTRRTLVNALARAPRRPHRRRLEPQRDLRRARQPAGRAGRVGRAAAAVPAAREHDLREPARRARRRRPAGRRRQAGRAAARPVPRPGARVRRATPSRPSATCRARSASPGRTNDLIELIDSFPPLARVALDNQHGQRRQPPRARSRRRPTALRAAAPDDRVRPALHARLRRLARRLLDHRRLRRPRRLLARLDQPVRAALRARPEDRPVPPLPGRRTRCRPPTAPTSDRVARRRALDCDPSQRSVGP